MYIVIKLMQSSPYKHYYELIFMKYIIFIIINIRYKWRTEIKWNEKNGLTNSCSWLLAKKCCSLQGQSSRRRSNP